MAQPHDYVQRLGIFLAGLAAGAVAFSRKFSTIETWPAENLQRSLAQLENHLREQEAKDAERFAKVEARIEEHEAKLADVPSSSQIVAAMDDLLSKAMASLDTRLNTQSHSIELLKTSLSQTDDLLKRVLESLEKEV